MCKKRERFPAEVKRRKRDVVGKEAGEIQSRKRSQPITVDLKKLLEDHGKGMWIGSKS